ncbi:MAG: hypothetical protein WCA37_15040 [Terracidiphilus sp.]
MSGSVVPVEEKPAPLTVMPLIVTAWLPVDDSVTDCESAVLIVTLPKLRLVGLTPRVLVSVLVAAGPNWIAKLADVPLIEACRVAVCAEDAAATVAVKGALVVPVVTLTELGTVTAELLLAMPTDTPPGGAGAFSVTVQLSVPEEVNDAVVQLRLDRVSAAAAAVLPEPFREIVVLP